LPRLPFNARKLFFLSIDLILAASSIYIAFLIRFDGVIPQVMQAIFYQQLLPTVICTRGIIFIYFGFYSGLWKYFDVKDIVKIIKAVLISSLIILFASFLTNRALIMPRSILIIDFFVLMSLLGSTRLIWRLVSENKSCLSDQEKASINVLILGANETGVQLVRHLNQNFPQYLIQGFIDNDPGKADYTLSGIRVLGTVDDLETIAKKLKTRQILITNSSLSLETLNGIFNICKKTGVKYKKVTSIFDISSKEVQITKISHFQTSDLLGRAPVHLDLVSMRKMIHAKRILVTGAGGSIGSELCYQINSFDPSCLIMVDIGENYLYDLETNLRPQNSRSENHYLLCSVVDQKKMESIFERFNPQLIFHAAAHKHVPLMEKSIDTAIHNNIHGTKVVLDLAKKYQADKLIMVSTDKVVKPTSIMGMTKHIAEKYVQHMAKSSSTRFMSVRFGNVLGSNGSVVPLFWKQILDGGPITITDPRMERYFMLISEAAQLILQATVLGKGGETFILEMGKPVKILDLAKQMIHFGGYTPEKDIEIQILGARQGEKLTEEIIDDHETFSPSSHEKIKILKSENVLPTDFPEQVDALIQKSKQIDQEKLRFELKTMIHNLQTYNK
jgi:FlaA1/EpsC-like NDP-sugar epimerase